MTSQYDNGWLPIESAPKTGEKVIIGFYRDWVVTSNNGRQSFMSFGRFKNGRWEYEGQGFEWEPTHWMPLPPPPKKGIA